MKKVLFVSTRSPVKNVSGGQDRSEMLLTFLEEKNYGIDVLCLEEFNRESAQINIIIKKHKFIRDLILGLIYLPIYAPLNVRLFWSYSLRRYLKDNSAKYDYIIYNNIRSFYPVEEGRNTILDYVDAISVNYRTINKRGLVKLFYRIEGWLTYFYEQRLLTKVRKAMVIAEYDASFLSRDVKVIPNWVDTQLVRRKTSVKNDNRIVIGFMGKMDYLPNIMAVNYFIDNIMPYLDNRFLFKIIGAPIHDSLLKLKSDDRIELTGYVDELESEMSLCDIFVAPMVDGAGLQNKVLHYMRFDKLVLSSPIGVRGFGAKISECEIVVCQDDDDWIRAIRNYSESQTYNYHLFLHSYYSKAMVQGSFDKMLS